MSIEASVLRYKELEESSETDQNIDRFLIAIQNSRMLEQEDLDFLNTRRARDVISQLASLPSDEQELFLYSQRLVRDMQMVPDIVKTYKSACAAAPFNLQQQHLREIIKNISRVSGNIDHFKTLMAGVPADLAEIVLSSSHLHLFLGGVSRSKRLFFNRVKDVHHSIKQTEFCKVFFDSYSGASYVTQTSIENSISLAYQKYTQLLPEVTEFMSSLASASEMANLDKPYINLVLWDACENNLPKKEVMARLQKDAEKTRLNEKEKEYGILIGTELEVPPKERNRPFDDFVISNFFGVPKGKDIDNFEFSFPPHQSYLQQTLYINQLRKMGFFKIAASNVLPLHINLESRVPLSLSSEQTSVLSDLNVLQYGISGAYKHNIERLKTREYKYRGGKPFAEKNIERDVAAPGSLGRFELRMFSSISPFADTYYLGTALNAYLKGKKGMECDEIEDMLGVEWQKYAQEMRRILDACRIDFQHDDREQWLSAGEALAHLDDDIRAVLRRTLRKYRKSIKAILT